MAPVSHRDDPGSPHGRMRSGAPEGVREVTVLKLRGRARSRSPKYNVRGHKKNAEKRARSEKYLRGQKKLHHQITRGHHKLSYSPTPTKRLALSGSITIIVRLLLSPLYKRGDTSNNNATQPLCPIDVCYQVSRALQFATSESVQKCVFGLRIYWLIHCVLLHSWVWRLRWASPNVVLFRPFFIRYQDKFGYPV